VDDDRIEQNGEIEVTAQNENKIEALEVLHNRK